MDNVIYFLYKHKDFYPEYFVNNRLSKCYYGYTCEINQIYCYLDLVDIKNTEYYKFYQLSQKFFDFNNKKILEVGCGYIPILSSIYKKNKFNITAINNKIIAKNYKKVKTIEYDLTENYDISTYDIIIGLRPCNITENILDMCYFYKKNFIIYLCPCIHNSSDKFNIKTYEDWTKYLYKKVLSYQNYKITIKKNHQLPDSCPVIIGKFNN